jgi:hypothetical protein
MIFVDAQSAVWTVGRPKWLGSRQWIPIKIPREMPAAGGFSGDIFELVVVVVVAVVWVVPKILGTLEYLIKLLIRPFRLLLQPSARTAGWGFDVVRAVAANAPVTEKPAPVRMRVWAPNRAGVRRLHQVVLSQLPEGGGFGRPEIQQAVRDIGATVRTVTPSQPAR